MPAPTFVQGKAWAATSSSGATAAMPANVTSGNMLIVFMEHSYAGCPPSITDTQGNTYTKQFTNASDLGADFRYYLFTATASSTAANTATMTFSCGNSKCAFFCEISGQAASSPYDSTAGPNKNKNTTNPCSTGAITTSADNELVISMFRTIVTRTFSSLSGTQQLSNGSDILMTEVLATAGSVNPSATASAISATYYVEGYVVAIKPAAGAFLARLPFIIKQAVNRAGTY